MDVNEHERLSNIMLRHKLKAHRFCCCFTLVSIITRELSLIHPQHFCNFININIIGVLLLPISITKAHKSHSYAIALELILEICNINRTIIISNLQQATNCVYLSSDWLFKQFSKLNAAQSLHMAWDLNCLIWTIWKTKYDKYF